MTVVFMIMNTYQLLSLKNVTKPTIAEILFANFVHNSFRA